MALLAAKVPAGGSAIGFSELDENPEFAQLFDRFKGLKAGENDQIGI